MVTMGTEATHTRLLIRGYLRTLARRHVSPAIGDEDG